jgi:hypothetical protein
MKKFITTLCVMFVVTLLACGGLPGVAKAAATSVTLTIAPGTRQCVGPLYAAYRARASGYVVSVPGQSTAPVKFTVASNNNQLYAVTSFSFFYEGSSQFSPAYFPGLFQACARNQDTKPVTVYLQLATDADVR